MRGPISAERTNKIRDRASAEHSLSPVGRGLGCGGASRRRALDLEGEATLTQTLSLEGEGF